MESNMVEISGIVDSVIFKNSENGFTICEIEDESGFPVVLAGTMPYLVQGDTVKARGKWIVHPVYGKQIKVESYEKKLPVGKNQILRYLSSGAVKGIGLKTAMKIVDKFGEDSFEALEKHPEWVAEINGISRKKAQEISKNFCEVTGARNVMIAFKDYLSDAQSMNVYKKWGGSAIDRVRENPYILCEEIDGIGFARADAVALGFGIDKNSPFRISGGILSFLQNISAKEGHTCMPLSRLKTQCATFLAVDPELVHNTVLDMLIENKLRVITDNGEKYIFTPGAYKAEKFIAERLRTLNRQAPSFGSNNIEALIMRTENERGIIYDEKQRESINASLEDGVVIITGGPGTGKTTVIKAIISIFESLGMDIALAAPTGRAAKRMSEATSCEASTIHRLLCMEYSEGEKARFMKNEDDLLEEDVFILDEASMIDVYLMEAFLKAVKPAGRIILIGDSDQLPSVGAGDLLHDLIKSCAFKTVNLTKIFRQNSESRIITNAHAINDGIIPELTNKNSDFFFMSRDSEEAIAQTVADLYKNRLPKKYGERTTEQIQVMTPTRKGTCGTEGLNTMLQNTLNPKDGLKKEIVFRNIVFREFDKVMQTKNNYSLTWEKDGYTGNGIFNGDIGTITDIDTSKGKLTIDFDEKICEYDFASLEEIEHAWAITVHKSQGSEYPIVILPLCSCAPMLLTRNLLYTAVTRAEKMVILVGKKSIFEQMVKNNRQAERYTGLKLFLKKQMT